MTCANCGTRNEAGQRFCLECGAKLAVVCPVCGASSSPAAKFCGACGTRLDAAGHADGGDPHGGDTGNPRSSAGAGAAGQGPVAERRLVSVLFTDLVGFTTLAEGRDAEDVRDLLSRYFELAEELVHRYGGTIEKFIGDAVMAVWGTPIAREDDAERAVRAALDLVAAVATLGPGVAARAGVLTGEAAVTLGATNQGMVAGDLVNTAARLQSAAAPGTVLAGEATVRAAGAAIAFEPIGEQALKGKAAPVPAWRALRVVAERRGRNRAEGLETPFVGREHELGLLKELFHATEREGRVRLVSVTGIGGIGKSRLAWELEKYLDGIQTTVRWHRGRAPAYGDGISFWSLGEMVRGRAGLVEGDDESTTREHIAALLDGLGLDDDDRRWIERALLTLLGVEAGAQPEHLFGAWRTFFERLATSAPVILVFEDLHWADAGTLDFIEHLLEWSRGVPLYVVTLARPELLERRPTWGSGGRSFTSVPLDPLPDAAMRALVEGLVPDLPDASVRAIVHRSEGVPFYAVETIRTLIADGRITAKGDGSYALADNLREIRVPETLTALIASRLDGLDPADRTILLDGAVLGQSFTVAALAAVAGLEPEALVPHLATLVRRELLMRDVDPRSPERGQYAFVQGLIREVAYNTLAKRDKKTRHVAAARYFESIGSDEIAAVLVGHYLAARESATDGPERDALAAQARVALRGAAERAASTADHGGALRFYDLAIEVTPEPADRADLLQASAEEALTDGRFAAAEERARAAVELRRALGDRLAIAASWTTLARVLIGNFRAQAARELLEPVVAEMDDLADDPAVIGIAAELARSMALTPGNERGTIEVADRVLDAAEHRGLGPIIADLLVTKGSVLPSIGRAVEGVALLRGGIGLAEQLGRWPVLLRGWNNLSSVEARLDPRTAFEAAQAGLALARRMGNRHFVPLLLNHLTVAGQRVGEWAAVEAELEAASAQAYEATGRIVVLSNLSWMRAWRGMTAEPEAGEIERLAEGVEDESFRQFTAMDLATVRAIAAGSLGEMRRAWLAYLSIPGGPGDDPLSLSLGAHFALWSRDPDDARRNIDQIAKLGVHGRAIDADRTTLEAGVAGLEGRTAESASGYRRALDAWRELGCRWDEALCGLDMALVLGRGNPDVEAVVPSTRAILTDLGAKPVLARLEAALLDPASA